MRIENRTRTNPIYNKVYYTWYDMMKRCYNEKSKDYKYYGEQGVEVCERWRTFKSFEEDIDLIDGFELENFLNSGISLDKDKKESGNKVYSLDTCCFVSRQENNKYKPTQQRQIVGISPEGIEYVFYNQSQFAREHNLTQALISRCAIKRVASSDGWKFNFKED